MGGGGILKVFKFFEGTDRGVEDTLKRIKSVSYFSFMRFESFKERVDFFSGYIGEEGVKERLRKSLGGFHKGNIEEMRLVIEFIEAYIGREGVKERMKKDLEGFSRAKQSGGVKRCCGFY